MLLFTNYFEKTGWSYLEIMMWIIGLFSFCFVLFFYASFGLRNGILPK